MRGRYAVLEDGTHVWVIPAKMLPHGHNLQDDHRVMGPYADRQLVVTTDVMVWSLPMTWTSYASTGEYKATVAAASIGARPTLMEEEYLALDEEARELYFKVNEPTTTEVPLDVSDFARVELNIATMPERPRNWEPGI